jgi:hypothetical protein
MSQTQQHGATTTTTSAATAAAADRRNAQEEYERKLREWQANGGHQQQQQYTQKKGVPLSVPLPVAAHGYYGPQAQGQTQDQQQMAAWGQRLERQTEYPPMHEGGGKRRVQNGAGHKGGKEGRGGHNNGRGKGDDPSLVLDLDSVVNGIDTRTSLMVRNIPNKYTQKMFLAEIRDGGHGDKIDFFYLPIDFKNKCNRGYAFVNFVDSADIVAFYNQYNTQPWRNFNSEKVCAITYARIQGKAAMVKRYQTQQRGATTTTTTTSAAGGGGNAQGEYAAMAAAALGGNAQGEYERKLRQPTRLPFCLQGKRSSSNPNPFKADEDRSPI